MYSEDDLGPSGNDLVQLRSKNLVFGRTLETEICSDGRCSITFGTEERSGSLYVNHHYDFRFGVAMCFEKRFGVEREEASSEITLTLVAIETF